MLLLLLPMLAMLKLQRNWHSFSKVCSKPSISWRNRLAGCSSSVKSNRSSTVERWRC